MPYISGENRNQLSLTSMCLDDYIADGHICRVIALYVCSLDMVELGFKYAETKETGRPPYAPASMLMLYLYGYLNRIRSSRRLEAETKRNVEVMWLMEKLTPDDKTISNFRKDNAIALKRYSGSSACGATVKDCTARSLSRLTAAKFAPAAPSKISTPKKGLKKTSPLWRKK